MNDDPLIIGPHEKNILNKDVYMHACLPRGEGPPMPRFQRRKYQQ
jgi:hypothetical protein